MILSSTSPFTTRVVAGAIALSLARFAGSALGAEPGAVSAQSTVTTRTTTVKTLATPVAKYDSKERGDPDEIRIKTLPDRLLIKSAQEPLWKDVAKVMRANDEKMDAVTTERHERAAKMTADEDLRRYGEITEQHGIGIKTFLPVFEKLYDSMSAEQKANADMVFRTENRKTAQKGT